MVDVKVFTGGTVKTESVDAGLFGDRVLGRTLKDAIVMYEANARAGTAKTKSRGEISGPNSKLWKQKHTGRARMGSPNVSHWRGGGTAFGPKPRDHSFHMPKKARRVALRNALFTKFRDGEVAVAEGWPKDAPSTKQVVAILKALEMEQSVLVVTEAHDANVNLSVRNIPLVDCLPVSDLNAYRVLQRRFMVVTPGALTALKSAAAAAGKAES